MTQSDPTATPQGSGGVATGPGQETTDDAGERRTDSSSETTRRSAPAARTDQAPRRQRIIPPLRSPDSTDGPETSRTSETSKTSESSGSAAGGGTGSALQTTPSQSAPRSPNGPARQTARSPQKTAATKNATSSTAAPKSAATKGVRPATGRTASGAAARKPRRARLRLTQIDAWTVMKTAFLLSIALGIVSVVAVAIVWTVLGAAGVFDSLNGTVQTLLGNDFRVQDYIGTGRVLGFTMLLAVVDVVLLTAIATLGAFLYNLSATLLGGVELTLTEDG